MTEREQDARINVAEASVVAARARLGQRLADYGFPDNVDSVAKQPLYGGHVGVDLALADLRTAGAELRAQRARLDRIELGSIDLRWERVQLETLARQVADARERLRRLTIVAPAPGVVLTDQMEMLPGRLVSAGDLVMEVERRDEWRAQLVVREQDVHRIRIGNRARLEIRAFVADSRNLVDGRVTHVAAEPTSGPDPRGVGRVYRVVVALDSTAVAALDPRRLRRGYSVRAKIITRSTAAVPLIWGFLKEKLDGSR